MGWCDDKHGKVFKSNELKLYYGGHTWGMKLSQLHKQSGAIRIVTYSLPRVEYAMDQLSRRPKDIWIVAHSKFLEQAKAIKKALPEIEIALNDYVHSKIVLIEPKTVYITSANFGDSRWHETCIGVRSKEAHDAYVENSFTPLWQSSTPIAAS
jgi:hypothetical protein